MRSYYLFILSAVIIFRADLVAGDRGKPVIETSRFSFGNRVPNRVWSPLRVKVGNPSKEKRNLGIVVEFILDSSSKARYIRKVELSPRSKRTVEMFVMMDRPEEYLRGIVDIKRVDISFSDGKTRTINQFRGGRANFRIQLVDADTQEKYGNELVRSSVIMPGATVVGIVNGRTLGEPMGEEYLRDGLPFVLGEHRGDYDYLATKPHPQAIVYDSQKNLPSADEEDNPIMLVRAEPGSMPDKWAAYEGVDVLMLGSLDGIDGSRGLTPQQRHSLLRYIKSGGNVLISPGVGTDCYDHPFWREVMPVRITGLRRLGGELSALEKRFGGKLFFDRDFAPYFVEAVAVPGAEVVYSYEGNVLLARRRVGSGSVWFSAVSGGSIGNWSGCHKFFSQVIRKADSPIPGINHGFADNSSAYLSSIVGVPAPSKGLVVVLLAAYIILTLSALVVSRWRGRAELAWPLMMIFALAGVVVSAVAAGASRSGLGYVRGEVGVSVLYPGMSESSTTSYVGLYSPEKDVCNIKWDSPDTLATGFSDRNTAGGMGADIGVTESDYFSFKNIQLKPGTLSTFRAMTMSGFGSGVTVDFRYGKFGVEGTVKNRSGGSLRDCILRVNRINLYVGDMTDGAEVKLRDCKSGWSLSGESDEAGLVRQRILAELLRQETGSGFNGKKRFSWPVAFYGWGDKAAAEFTVEGKDVRDSSLRLLVVPVDVIKASGKVRSPAGACPLRFLRGGGGAFGNPFKLRKPVNIEYPGEMHLAGTEKSFKYPRSSIHPSGRSAGTGGSVSMVKRNKEQSADTETTGWKPASTPMGLSFTFERPHGLERMKVDSLTLTASARLSGYTAQVGIRKPGTKNFSMLRDVVVGRKVTSKVFSGSELKKYMGHNGELPEFTFRPKSTGDNSGLGNAYWWIREFDIALEGDVK